MKIPPIIGAAIRFITSAPLPVDHMMGTSPRNITPTVITIVTMIGSFALLAIAMRSLPLGTAYTIWTGIGAVGAFVVGIAVLGEQASAMRIIAALLIVSGLMLMKISSPG